MIFWMLFLSFSALIIIVYFHYIEVLFGKSIANKRIDKKKPIAPKRSEYQNTFKNLIIYGLTGLFLGYAIEAGWTQVYDNPLDGVNEILYAVVSLFAALLLHDVYFYASHRLLHSRFLFKHIHAEHHKSHNTNAWAALSFHPVEGILHIAIVPLVAVVIPIHTYVLIFFSFFMSFITTYGHCGYELRANKWKVFSIFNTSLHHYQHHKFVHYNYGIYLNIWDRIFSTNHPSYVQSFETLAKSQKRQKHQTITSS